MEKSIYTGDHVIIQIKTIRKDLLTSLSVVDKYLRLITKVAMMTALEAPRVYEVPFANELDTYTEKLIEECGDKGIVLNTVSEMSNRINARKCSESGVTGTITWAESHAAIHTWAEKDFLTIDLYSCKSFDIDAVIDFTKHYWDANFTVYRVLNRYTDKNIISEDIVL